MKTNKTPSAYRQLCFGLWSLPPHSSAGMDPQAGFCTPTVAASAQDPHHPSTPTPSSQVNALSPACISGHLWREALC